MKHEAYSLGYSEEHEQAAWVYYLLTKAHLNAAFSRSDRFVVDPLVETGSADDEDYAKSGYDRGHLAPAADMSFSENTMQESFYYSNMSPQNPSFNRGIWKKAEEQTRAWAAEYDSLYIVTGPILSDSLPTIGPNKVSVPKYYYKIILDLDPSHLTAMALLIPNEKSSAELNSFLVSIDSIETLTNIDFFAALPDSLENALESKTTESEWNWEASFTSSGTKQEANSQQCLGITKSGERCQNSTNNNSGFCHLHTSQYDAITGTRTEAVQCFGTTESGTRCKRMTKNSSGKCFQHE